MTYNKFIKKDGKVLLDLTSDTVASDKLMSGVTAHNRSGEAINGTFTIDNELATQDNLIAQIQTALQGKASGGSTEDLDSVISELETKAATLNTTLANKAAGGGGSVEICTVQFCHTSGSRPEPSETAPVVCYIGEDLIPHIEPYEWGETVITTIKNSLITVEPFSSTVNITNASLVRRILASGCDHLGIVHIQDNAILST